MWSDDFENIRRYIERKIEEIEEILWGPQTESQEEYLRLDVKEPLHSIYDLGEKYIIVIDVPWADESKVLVNAVDNDVEVKVKLKRKLNTSELGYKFLSQELEEYHKKITVPRDADVSQLVYKIKSGRIIIELPKTRDKVY